MALINEETLIQYIKDELSAGIVNLELSDELLARNLHRSLMLSSDYFNYTSFVQLVVNKTTGSGGWINLTEIDPDGIPVIVAVYPTANVLNIDAALLGLGSVFISTTAALNPQLNAYAGMLNRLSNLESILGRNAKVVGDKLFVDHYFSDITVEYIPNVITIENINEGAWVRFLIDYTTALCKRQLVQTRGKYVVDSNPAAANADQLLEQANATLEKLEEELKLKGALLASR
jgi:hypothetical protein